MLLDTTISFITLLLMASTPVLPVMLVGSFVIGASAASGVMQMGMTIMGIAFPKAKGRITGIYNMAGALSSFTIPIVTGVLSKTSVHSIMWFDVFIAAIGIVCSLCVILIFKKSHVSVTEEVA
jgi:MFS family permease